MSTKRRDDWLGQATQRPHQGLESNWAGSNHASRKRSYFGCKICDRGTLNSKAAFRMSGPAVVIGFILLVPSILGMLFSAGMLLFVTMGSGKSTVQTRNAAITEMRQHDVPERIIQQVVKNPDMDITQFIQDDDMNMVSYSWLKDADMKLRSDGIANGLVVLFGGGFFIAIGIASFVGGLLGWLLVMRKRVLQCDTCGAVVNAS